MEGTSRPQTVSTKLQKIAEQAKRCPELIFKTLMHHVTVDFLMEAFLRTNKKGAPGISGVTAVEYELNLEENLKKLHGKLREGKYKAPPVKRVWIEKEDKSRRPIAIPELEDKIVQRAVVMLLESIYEQDFHGVSYGFRKGRNPHQAINTIREKCRENNIGWIVDADIKGYFDNIDHEKFKITLKKRVNDGSLIRLIGKWLKAGILEDGSLYYPELGAPQGGVISPMISNIYLHHVLDRWYINVVKPRLKGRSFLVRFADDFVIGCENEKDAHRIMEVLPKRFGKYGLTIHPEKTKLVRFKKPYLRHRKEKKNGTFDFLGFTHYWTKSLKGYWVIKRKTIGKRLRRSMKNVWNWCKENIHKPLKDQYRTLCSKLRGHYYYYGIRCNIDSMMKLYRHTRMAWKYWLNKRSQRGKLTWMRFYKLEKQFELVKPRIIHNI